jgi:hypothetical protein
MPAIGDWFEPAAVAGANFAYELITLMVDE